MEKFVGEKQKEKTAVRILPLSIEKAFGGGDLLQTNNNQHSKAEPTNANIRTRVSMVTWPVVARTAAWKATTVSKSTMMDARRFIFLRLMGKDILQERDTVL